MASKSERQVLMARRMNDDEAKVFNLALQRIRTKEYRNKIRGFYFDAKIKLEKVGPSIPVEMHDFATMLGWANKAVTVPASRIKPHGFTCGAPTSLLEEIEVVARESSLDMFENLAIESALQDSCSFVFVTPGDTAKGEPQVIISVRSALEATAERDRRTGRIVWALEMVSRKEAILYLPGRTLIVKATGSGWMVDDQEIQGVENFVPCVPYVWRRTLARPFGYSRISRPLMNLIDNGIRTLLRQEANAEHYSAPRMAMYGAMKKFFTDENGEKVKPWSREIGAIFGVPDLFNEETGQMDRAKLEQFAQATFQPHTDMMRQLGMLVSGETSIPVGYLGIIHDNPSSADAIRANEVDLMSTVIGAEIPKLEATRWELARAIVVAIHGAPTEAMIKTLRTIKPHMIDGATNTPSARADFSQKFASQYPEYATSDPVLAGWGWEDSAIVSMKSHALKMGAGDRIKTLLDSVQAKPVGVAPVVSDPAPTLAGKAV